MLFAVVLYTMLYYIAVCITKMCCHYDNSFAYGA